MAGDPGFVHLRIKSAFTLLGSMLKPKAIADWAVAAKAPALAVCDDDNLFGALELSETLAGVGVQPIPAFSLTLEHPSEGRERPTSRLSLYAKDETGWMNLMALSSRAFLNAEGGAVTLPVEAVEARSDGVIALTGGADGRLAQLIATGRDEEARLFALRLRAAFCDRLYIEIGRHGRDDERLTEAGLIDLAYDLDLPLAATQDARCAGDGDIQALDALLCIAARSAISQDDRPKALPAQRLKSEAEMQALFADLPEAVANTVEIARRCAFRPTGKKPILPRFAGDDVETEAAELDRQVREGLKTRFAEAGQLYADEAVYWDRLDFELRVIRQMGFPGYFLIVADFIKYAKANAIPVGPGRGSGAGSLVAWALTITDLDPIRFGLLFERFLNPERVSMPDFDIDFCQERRGEVIDYVRRKYGDDRVASIITFGSLQARAVLRDVGRVMQLPFGQVDRLAKMIPFNPANPMSLPQAVEAEPRLQEAMDREPEVKTLIETAKRLEGLYRNPSVHAAGVVIGDRPLEEIAPLYRDPDAELPVTQYNMKWAEAGGLVKFDFLGLKTLTVIDRALKFIAKEGETLKPSWTRLDEPAAYELMASGDTLGVFQLEGQGMRETLRRVRPSSIEDVIAIISLYRPGPMDNIPAFCEGKEDAARIKYPHPDLRPVLEETYGIPVYQEQVMRMAQEMAGYSLGEADLLRRAMGKKKQEEMDQQRARFVAGAKEHKGVAEGLANAIFDTMAKFAGYGFNKSHAAAYAVIAYQTAYLKALHPTAFLAASMSLDIDNTDKLAAFFQEARRLGVEVTPPCVQASQADFDVEGGRLIYALAAIKGVGGPAMRGLIEARKAGRFQDVFDLAERVDPRLFNKRVFESLARAGAFDRIEPSRARIFAGADRLAACAASAQENRAAAQESLFGEAVDARPSLPDAAEWSQTERLDHEFAAVGFYFSGHPLDEIIEGPARYRLVLAADLAEASKTRAGFEMVGVVRARVEKPARSGGKFAYATFSDPSGEYEIMIPPEVLAERREVLQTGEQVHLRIRTRKRDDEVRLLADDVSRLADASLDAPTALSVRLSPIAALDRLAGAVEQLKKAPARARGAIFLDVPMRDGGSGVIRLPDRYCVDYKAIAVLKSVPGVERIETADAAE